MKWRTVLCTALFLYGTVLLSACGGGEMPAPAEPPASSEVSAPSQPEEVTAPSESALPVNRSRFRNRNRPNRGMAWSSRKAVRQSGK